MENAVGLYFHVPFCDGKCPYCDFYSLRGDEGLMDRYLRAVRAALARWSGEHGPQKVKTVYFGGGTPSLLGPGRLGGLLEQAAKRFSIADGAEVTLEANPASVGRTFFADVRKAGFNRLSMGLQSADPAELRLLGRRHTPQDAAQAVEDARAAGFDNISLDLMLGLPGGGEDKLKASIDFAAGLGPEHISAYILKVEENTPFGRQGVQVPPDDDTADQYLFLVEELKRMDYVQYEISNFAKPGKESRHNLVYWHGEEYLGFGPGAHSFYGGERYYYPRDLEAFLRGEPPVPDGEGGGFPEYVMLNLRLSEGLRLDRCEERFGGLGAEGFLKVRKNAEKCPPSLVRADSDSIHFTPEGFLVSNTLILELLEGIE